MPGAARQVVVIGDEIVLVGLLDLQRRVAIYGRPPLRPTAVEHQP
jgi:hypothetical protein